LKKKGIIPTKFEIACNITKNAYISYHSAFEFYGYTNQVYNEVVVSSPTQFHDFTFEHNTYRSKRVKNTLFVETVNNIKVSSLAKTIVDSIDNVKTYDDLEELINILNMIPLINGNEVLAYLKHVNKTILYSKVGLLLSFYEDDYNIKKEMLNEMKKHGLQIARNFTSEKHRLNVYYKDWKLHAYNISKSKEEVI
jgi:predicted transcriptional regulator of viral defense system